MPPRYFDETHRPRGPNYFGDSERPKKADWKKHERDIAKRAGEHQVVGSGNKPGRPGDTMGSKFLRQAKAMLKTKGISVRAAWLKELVEQALVMNRTPVMEIRLESAEFPMPTDWVLIPALDFQALLEKS